MLLRAMLLRANFTGWSRYLDDPIIIMSQDFTVEELQAICIGLLPYTRQDHALVFRELWPDYPDGIKYAVYPPGSIPQELWADMLLLHKFPEHAEGFVDEHALALAKKFTDENNLTPANIKRVET